MRLYSLTIAAAVAALLTNCTPESDDNTTKDIITDIDGSDEARVTPFIYYIDGENVVRGECSADASFTRAQCQANIKTMKEEVFTKRVGLEVQREKARIDTALNTSEQKISSAKDEANGLLVKNHDLQKKMEAKNLDITENDGRIASKETDIAGLEEQLKATEAALAAGPAGPEQQQLLAIKSKLGADILTAKKALETLKAAAAALGKELEALKSEMAANSSKIDALIAVQNEETARIAELNSELAVTEADIADMESTMKLLKADLIPYSINAASTDFAKNKRWLQRFDLVMTGQVAVNEVRVGSPDEFSGSGSLSAGYLFFKQIVVSQKMDIRRLGFISKSNAPEAHLAVYSNSDKKLIATTAAFSVVTGRNEIDTAFSVSVEPGTYLISIQASSQLMIGQGSSTGTYNYNASNVYPSLPDTLGSLSSSNAYNWNLYMVGDTY